MQITTFDNGNVHSHEQEESKLYSAIKANTGTHTLSYDRTIKSPLNKNNVATIKSE